MRRLPFKKPVRSHSETKLLFTTVKSDSWVNEDNSVETSLEFEETDRKKMAIYFSVVFPTKLISFHCLKRGF